MNHRTYEELRTLLTEAAGEVSVGALYRHTKSDTLYKITGLAILEVDDTVAVRYVAAADATVEFIRPLTKFVELIELDGMSLPRFEIHQA